MFEKFQVDAFYVTFQALLSLYTTGKTTGTVLDVGDGVTQSFAIYEGYALPSSTKTLNLSGRDLTDNLMERLNQSGQSFSTNADREIVRDIKEKCCYVSEFVCKKDDTPVNKPETEKSYKLPDGSELKLGSELHLCPEALFKPSLCGANLPGIHEIVNQSVTSSDEFIWKDLYKHVILTGASSLFSGLPQRVKSEVQSLAAVYGPKSTVNVVAPEHREYSAWYGGSILGSLQTFASMWITRTEYDICGPDIVHRKCS